MSSILPRRYNNSVVLGLSIALVVAVAAFLYMTYSQPVPQKDVIPAGSEQATAKPPSSQETLVSTNKPALVMLYANWCGHSKAMLPAWEAAKEKLEAMGHYEVLKFDDETHPEEIKRIAVHDPKMGFPDIRFYPQGYPSDKQIKYRGDRSEDSLIKFVYSGGEHA